MNPFRNTARPIVFRGGTRDGERALWHGEDQIDIAHTGCRGNPETVCLGTYGASDTHADGRLRFDWAGWHTTNRNQKTASGAAEKDG